MTPSSAAESPELARDLLQAALDDLRREARQAGRDALFDDLQPALLGAPLPAGDDGGVDPTLLRALRRLRTRLHERVEARLRGLEPDPTRRRALREHLRATLNPPSSR